MLSLRIYSLDIWHFHQQIIIFDPRIFFVDNIFLKIILIIYSKCSS